jgi:hypothetical protein
VREKRETHGVTPAARLQGGCGATAGCVDASPCAHQSRVISNQHCALDGVAAAAWWEGGVRRGDSSPWRRAAGPASQELGGGAGRQQR